MLKPKPKRQRSLRRRIFGDKHPAIVLGAVSGLIAGVYLSTKNANVALETLGIFIVLAITSLIMLVVQFAKRDEEQSWFNALIRFSLGLGLAALFVGSFAATVNAILYRIPGRYLNWIAIGVAPAGYAAHRLKRLDQFRYGVVEVLAAVATGLGSTTRYQIQSTQALTILGAIYVAARGFGNISEARARKSIATSKAPS